MVAGGACSTCVDFFVDGAQPRAGIVARWLLSTAALKVPIPARRTRRPQCGLERRRRVGGQNLHVWRRQLRVGREERRKCGHCITIAVRVDDALPACGRGVNDVPKAAASRFRGRTHQRATDGAIPTYSSAKTGDYATRNPFCNRKNEILIHTKHAIFPSPEIGGNQNFAHGFSGPMITD